MGTDQEFVEIHNPNNEAVDLSDYYLTDAIYSHGQPVLLAHRRGQPAARRRSAAGRYTDFHARFPDGFTIGAGVDHRGLAGRQRRLRGRFGFLPDLEMYEDGDTADEVPDMRYVFGDDTNNSIINRTGTGSGQPSTPGLTNGGETVILYHWDGGEDLVVDIDMFV